MIRMSLTWALILIVVGCGYSDSTAPGSDSTAPGSDSTTPGSGSTTPNSECIPTSATSLTPLSEGPDRRIENIVEYLTGERQTSEEDPVEGLDDPNYGGVWGAPDGRIVVAVVDCSKIDPDRIAELAGGSDAVHVIEVTYSFGEVEAYRDALVEELKDLGIQADVPIEPTLSGRFIVVRVEDRESVPPSFGAGVPDDLFSIVEGPLLQPLE